MPETASRARGAEFAEQRGSAEQAFEFGEDFFEAGAATLARLAESRDESFESGEVLLAEFGDEVGGNRFAGFGAVGGMNEAIGDAAHGGNDGNDVAAGEPRIGRWQRSGGRNRRRRRRCRRIS